MSDELLMQDYTMPEESKDFSAAFEEVRKGCKEINAIADEAAAQTERVIAEFKAITEKAGDSVKSVEKTDSILKYTQSITTQMTLLGFNASIEAKRVGAAGEGFNVIAQEVRKLAEQTASQTADIESVLNEIKHAIKAIVTELNSAFTNLNKNAATIQELNAKVSSTMELVDKE